MAHRKRPPSDQEAANTASRTRVNQLTIRLLKEVRAFVHGSGSPEEALAAVQATAAAIELQLATDKNDQLG